MKPNLKTEDPSTGTFQGDGSEAARMGASASEQAPPAFSFSEADLSSNTPIIPERSSPLESAISPEVSATVAKLEEVSSEVAAVRGNRYLEKIVNSLEPSWWDRMKLKKELREPTLQQVRSIAEGGMMVTRIAVEGRVRAVREHFETLAKCHAARTRRVAARFILDERDAYTKKALTHLQRFLHDHQALFALCNSARSMPGVTERLLAHWAGLLEQELRILDKLSTDSVAVVETQIRS